MNINCLKIMILAAVSDGEIQDEELHLIQMLRSNIPSLKALSEADFNGAVAEIYNALSSGIAVDLLVQNLGKELSPEERNRGYALAMEVCRANFDYIPVEQEFINELEVLWDIESSIVEAITVSSDLRYN
jgi:uncharacterized membrane protein YebE (DUF533 family)